MSGAFNPFALLPAAAAGDIEAQRALADGACGLVALCDQSMDPLPILSDGLVFARLAAAQGDHADNGRLVTMLGMACDLCGDERRIEYAGEAIAVAERMAEAGSEHASELVPLMVDKLPPEAAAMAQHYRKWMAAE